MLIDIESYKIRSLIADCLKDVGLGTLYKNVLDYNTKADDLRQYVKIILREVYETKEMWIYETLCMYGVVSNNQIDI